MRNRADVRLVKIDFKIKYQDQALCHKKYLIVTWEQFFKMKNVLTLNKPAYAGMCIIDLSKE